ncbi:MAG: glycosyltransferase family 2 protein [Myxococcales bacterium FL481]|nr:MAG: glycosyltransferase family 2 protein [Myxococcales bacterium FL481]
MADGLWRVRVDPHADEDDSRPAPYASFVVPVYNERDSLEQLHREITEGAQRLERPYEIIYINDGSRDGSDQKLDELADAHTRVVHFRRNFGKSPALAAGFELARGEIVMTLDGDLQDDPAMIPDFAGRIEAGADLVCGWKKTRHDALFGKTLPSRTFNWLVRRVTGVSLHDINCGYKAYRRACIDELSVYGGMHRFMPALAAAKGFQLDEIVVQHRARQHGYSKFGARRFLHGLMDLLTVVLITQFRTQPLHLFALPGLGFGVAGSAILGYLGVLWLMGEPIGTRPLLTLGVLLITGAIQLISTGLVGELLVRSMLSNNEKFSIVRMTQGGDPPSPADANG